MNEDDVMERLHPELPPRVRRRRGATRRPYRDRAGATSCTPFFVIGSGRSGNTLLRAILNAHPDVAIPPESYMLGDAVNLYATWRSAPWPVAARRIAYAFTSHPEFHTWRLDPAEVTRRMADVPRGERSLAAMLDRLYTYYAEVHEPGAVLWGDKTPLNTLFLPLLDRVWPDAKYVHILRDGRDVAASYVSSGLYDDLGEAADRWLRSVQEAQTFREYLPEGRYMEVRYRDLVSDPAKEVERLCAFLGLEVDDAMLAHHKTADRLGDTTAHQHHGQVHRPITTKSVGRWRERLKPEEQRLVVEKLGPTLKRLGYE